MPAEMSPALALLFLLGGFALLTGGAEILLRGSVRIARRFGVSDLVIGVTLVALGTSAPELFVSLKASLAGADSMALGNVVGSNVCNTLLVLGTGALILPFAVNRKAHLPQAVVALLVSLLVLGLARWGYDLGTVECAGLLTVLAIWVLLSIRSGRQVQVERDATGVGSPLVSLILVVVGLVVLWLGSEGTVGGARSLAAWVGLEERVIAISVVALGTSLPELVTSLLAAIKKSPDLALGNIIGSNIFNLLCILGAAGLASPITVDRKSIPDLLTVSVVALFLLLPVLFCRRIGRRWGLVALLGYLGYLLWAILSGRV